MNMISRLLNRLPLLGTLFLLFCTVVWLLMHQRMAAAAHERQHMTAEQNTLQDLTLRWDKESQKMTADSVRILEGLLLGRQVMNLQKNPNIAPIKIAPEQALQASLNDQMEEINRHTAEYRQLAPVDTAVKQKTFAGEYSTLSKARNRIRTYVSQLNKVAAEMQRRAAKLN